MKHHLQVLWLLSACVLTACAPAYRTYPQQAAAPPQPDSVETKPHLTVRLVNTVPPLDLSPTSAIVVERTFTVKSTYIGSYIGWSTSKTSRFAGKGSIIVVHRNVQFAFGFTPLELGSVDFTDESRASSSPLSLTVLIRNPSQSGVQIDWNAVNIIGKTGKAYPIIHRGVKMAERSGVLAPSTVPPGATLDEFIYPRELISFSSSRYGSSWLGVQFFEAMKPGDRFTLYLPIKHGGEPIEYQFVFEIGSPPS